MYLWVKAFHLISMVTWFAALFYLPRLFVYHAAADDSTGIERFKVMERKLYRGIMTPSAVITVSLGIWLAWLRGLDWVASTHWLHAKLVLAVLLIGYHVYLGRVVKRFAADANRRSHVYYRWINELPVIALVGMIILAVVKPAW